MKFFNSPRLVFLGLVVLLGLGFAAWRSWPSRPSDQAAGGGKHGARDQQVVPVGAAPVRVEDVPVTIDAVGTVQALNTATIRSQVDGRLVKLPFNEGEDVKKGKVVAMIEPNLYQAQYDQTVAKKSQDEATLSNARLDLIRYKKLTVGHYGSQQQYDTPKVSGEPTLRKSAPIRPRSTAPRRRSTTP